MKFLVKIKVLFVIVVWPFIFYKSTSPYKKSNCWDIILDSLMDTPKKTTRDEVWLKRVYTYILCSFAQLLETDFLTEATFSSTTGKNLMNPKGRRQNFKTSFILTAEEYQTTF